MPSRFLIYSLCDPRTQEVRYVGLSTIGLDRPQQHWTKHKNNKDHCHAWVRSLLREGLQPDVDVLEELETSQGIADAERFWIASWRLMGARLTNMTDGGQGIPGHRHSQKTKELMARNHISPGMTGISHRPDSVEKIRRSNTGLKRSRETVENIRRSMTGNRNASGKRSPEAIENIRKARWGK